MYTPHRKLPQTIARVFIVPDRHEQSQVYFDWETALNSDQVSCASFWYPGKYSRLWWGNHASFADAVDELTQQMHSASASGKKNCLIGIGAGALVAYAASMRIAPHALAMISSEMPIQCRTRAPVSAKWYRACTAINDRIGRCTPPRRSIHLPEYAGVNPDRARAYAKRLVSAPARLVTELEAGLWFAFRKSLFTKIQVVAGRRDGLHTLCDHERLADAVGAELRSIDETRIPALWSPESQKEMLRGLQEFFAAALQDRPRIIRVA